jgi:ribosomal subunit interface protein
MDKSEFIDNVLDKNLKKIERRLKIFRRGDSIHISVHIEKNPHREQYFCRTHIYLPSKVLNAEEKASNSTLAINKTFLALSKQLDKLKYKLESHLRKKTPR